ncbi:hypothetical protein HPG69_017173 [Diceros bicornis minor]|uniref:Uncharacterized protein n=1 Tax=Diceros bicornis minor TaxID=77932 RepID=A0A7J7ECY8_DICBM|nr:hypothetical protein HPG69_017173 [Diceros bicornis minor]
MLGDILPAFNEAKLMSDQTLNVTALPNQTLPAPKQSHVQPTFSKYLALNRKCLDVKQAFNPEGGFQHLAAQSGLYESEKFEYIYQHWKTQQLYS